jgi:hypothetical protein
VSENMCFTTRLIFSSSHQKLTILSKSEEADIDDGDDGEEEDDDEDEEEEEDDEDFCIDL